MNKLTQDTLKAFKTYDIGYLMEARFRMGIVAGLFNNEITSFEVDNPNANIQLECDGVKLIGGTREQLSSFLRIFGNGGWKKEVHDYYPDKMNYYREMPHPLLENSTLRIEATQVTPPPSCKVEEYEVEEPAKKVMKRRIVCNQEESAAEVIPVTDSGDGVVIYPSREEQV